MLNFGIIGAGRLGTRHAENLAAIENAKVAAVYDINAEKAQFVHDKYGAEICNSAEELAAKVDAVVVASPSDCHIEGVRAAIQADKHVFSEKPLCRFAEQAEEYHRLFNGFKKVYGIGFVRRHILKTQLFKQMLDDNKIGRIRFCNVDLPFGGFRRMQDDWFANYKRSGGVILDMLAHHIDLANWFFGKAKRVYAQGMMLDPTQKLPSDYVSATITYENDVYVNMMCSWQRFGRSNEMMEVYGENGALTLNSSDKFILSMLGEETREIDATENVTSAQVDNASTGNGFMNEMVNFIHCIETGETYKPGIPEAFASFAVAEAMMRSAETGKVVEL